MSGGDALTEITGLVVTRIELVGFVRIRFGNETDVPALSVESSFEVTDADGNRHPVTYSPAAGSPPAGLDVLAALYGQTVTDAVMREDGSFRIAFGNGAALTIPVDPDYEAGHLVTRNDYLVIPPGGR